MVNPIKRLINAFDALPATIALIDMAGQIKSVNAMWHKLAEEQGGVQDLCGIGANYLDVCDAAYGDGREDGRHVAQGIRAVLAGQLSEFNHEYALKVINKLVWYRVTVRPIHDGAVIMHVDVTGLFQAREITAEAVGNDTLTDLATRSRFDMDIEELVQASYRHGIGVGMAIVKIEGLASINTRLGYQTGDIYLREMAARLRAKLSAEDLLARLGGDEFAVARPLRFNSTPMNTLAQHIVRVLHKPLLIQGEVMNPVVSVGVASMPAHGSDAPRLMDFADQAAQVAHSRGGGVYCLELEQAAPSG